MTDRPTGPPTDRRGDPAPDPVAEALTDLAFAQTHDHALVELEIAADATGEPLPDRAAATFVAWALRAAGAHRVVELGAGRGALTWWLAGATGLGGELHAVTDPGSAATLVDRLRRAGRYEHVTVHVTDTADGGASPEHLGLVGGDLDAVVVPRATPQLAGAWDAVVSRLRPGGIVLLGEVLVDGPPTGWAEDVVRDALEDPELWATLVPLGDGWLAALRARSDLGGAATERLW